MKTENDSLVRRCGTAEASSGYRTAIGAGQGKSWAVWQGKGKKAAARIRAAAFGGDARGGAVGLFLLAPGSGGHAHQAGAEQEHGGRLRDSGQVGGGEDNFALPILGEHIGGRGCLQAVDVPIAIIRGILGKKTKFTA